MQFRKRLPSLTALVALEATIRHRSVTAAAKELGVTQAAVSRNIAQLEEEFGRPLFSRAHRQIEPTPSCSILGSALAESFTDIAVAVDAMRLNASEMVTIGATIGFSSLWLLPQLAEFRRRHPGVHVRVISQDKGFNLGSGEVDIVLRFGRPPFNDGVALASRDDLVFPVCSPDYARAHDLTAFPEGGFELIETDFPDRTWYRWMDWLDDLGLKTDVDIALRFSYFTDSLMAARASQGIALGWEALVGSYLADGSLVRIGSLALKPQGAHNVVVPHRTKQSTPVKLVVDWLAQALEGQ